MRELVSKEPAFGTFGFYFAWKMLLSS